MPSEKAKPPSPASALVLLLLAASFAVPHARVICGDSVAASPSPAPQPASTTAGNSSAFGANLQTLLNSLPQAAAPTGFASLSLGTGRDRAVVRGLCRGDSAASTCLADLIDAVQDLSGQCASSRSAGAWYERCCISYADTNDSTIYEQRINDTLYDTRRVADPDGYERSYYALMSRLVARASGGGGGGNGNRSARTSMFDTGEAVYAPGDPNGTMYGFVQCMRDRSDAECERCLKGLVPRLPSCCKGYQGGVAQNFNCQLRIQLYTPTTTWPSTRRLRVRPLHRRLQTLQRRRCPRRRRLAEEYPERGDHRNVPSSSEPRSQSEHCSCYSLCWSVFTRRGEG